MADVDRAPQIERRDQFGDVGRVGVHLIAFAGLARPAVTAPVVRDHAKALPRSEEHTSELQSLMRISYAVFCLKKKKRSKAGDTQATKHKQTIRQLDKTTKH